MKEGLIQPTVTGPQKGASILLCKLEILHNEISSCKIHNLHKEDWGKDVKPKITPSPALLEADFFCFIFFLYLIFDNM